MIILLTRELNMARPRTFEPKEALDKAMTVFWRKGYAETSYDDLVSETGVSRKGLYTVFGDKEDLFLAALRHYCRVRIPQMFEVLDQKSVTLDQIETMFRWLTDQVANGQLSQGCFMANTAADDIIHNPKVKAAYDSYLKFMVEQLTTAFIRAGLGDEAAKRLSIYYMGVLQSLQLMAHARTDEGIVRSFMDTALGELRRAA